jgi:putative tRNA adenosine deaminase-associated protein|tara:strand:+ start:8555 stop:9040 length:486 start_codon:yes stop_codon:yes gene_type:complete
MSAKMGYMTEATQDFAIEAWHEDGRWSIASLPDPDDLTHIIDRLKKQQTNGGAVALIAIDDEFFLAVRVLGTHVKFFISDISCAIDYEVAAEFLELADIDQPEEEDEPLPAGDIDIFSDLGLHSMELSTLCDDADLFPDEQIEAIANRLGFAEELSQLLES